MKCGICGKNFDSERSYAGHLAYCGKDSKTPCSICGKIIWSKHEAKHYEWHTCNDSACAFCGKGVIGKRKFCNRSCSAKYTNIHGGRWRNKIVGYCEQCGKMNRKGYAVKFCSRKCQAENRKDGIIARMNSGEHIASTTVRRIMLSIREHRCEICDNDTWNGLPIHLVVDHLDGNPYNDRASNLRLICPNCDSQTPTYMARNKGNGRLSRRIKYQKDKQRYAELA